MLVVAIKLNSMRLKYKPYALDCAIVLLLSIAIIYLFYPGFMSYDSWKQLYDAKNRHIGDAHPPIMSMIWRGLDAVYPGPALMLILQVALFSVSLAFVAIRLAPHPVGRLPFLLLLIFPPSLGIIGIIWKDVWMHGFLLGCLAVALYCHHAQGRARIALLVAFSAMAFMAATFRHNAVAAIPPFAMLAFYGVASRPTVSRLRNFTVTALISLVFTAVVLFVNGLVTRVLADYHENFSQVLMTFDVAGTSSLSGRRLFSSGYADMVDDTVTVADIQARYTPRFHSCLYNPCTAGPGIFRTSMKQSELDHLRKDWLLAIVTEPRAWMEHKYHVAREIIRLGTLEIWAPTLEDPLFPNDWGITFNDTPVRAAFRKMIFAASGTWIYNTYMYLAGAVVVGFMAAAGLLWTQWPRAQLAAALALAASGTLYETSLFFGATSADFRYSVWLIICTWLAICSFVSALIVGRR
ncbi:hypothetical protein QRO08_19760 [Paracidovorax citrulli]|nr:hypothetical protein [Paracidovorax citrulli]UMT84671.1 hypothetical protein FRC75_15625 [Paracidovorax citrulli]UMT87203.1 hypothetical protein FRC90_03390 [Paracidovorax citrulli]WIY28481.1 hypothetical protein QRO09_15650 [Paracidovorax citrulli]WIY37712.1 hypothetical protein QRO10_15915 [Paracidovorax citrulli]WIY45073.1 hypothetical protein QRO12_05140 [Paracidovorax citrulli]